VEAAVDEHHAHIDDQVVGEDALLQRVFDAAAHRGNELGGKSRRR
jgi:hypothetical protein